MTVLVLSAKTAIAVILLTAGAAKLANRSVVSETIRLFLPGLAASARLRDTMVLAISAFELSLAVVSLTSPKLVAVNVIVFALCCVFVFVSGIGYIFHRGKSCMCFGALSRRRFDAAGLGRSLLLAGAAATAMQAVPPESVTPDLASRILLLVAAALVAFAGFIAARALVFLGDSAGRAVSK